MVIKLFLFHQWQGDSMKFEITNQSIEGKNFKEGFLNPRVGGVVTFEGRVRNHNEDKDVSSLEYEVYPELAQKEGEKIIQEALTKFDIVDVYCVHREGHLQIGEMAVWVIATSEHRENAFLACQYIIDEVKARVPIWKKEHYVNQEAIWVRCDKCANHQHHGSH
jgi:molybdopterin synthase catalytic subunit